MGRMGRMEDGTDGTDGTYGEAASGGWWWRDARFLHKPQVFIDDQLAQEWPHFVHIAPDKLGSIEEYRRDVAAKKDGKT